MLHLTWFGIFTCLRCLHQQKKIYIYMYMYPGIHSSIYIYIYGWMLLHFTMSQPCPLFWGSCKSNRPWSSSSSPSALSSLSVTGLEKYHDDELKECEAKNGYMMGSPIASGFFFRNSWVLWNLFFWKLVPTAISSQVPTAISSQGFQVRILYRSIPDSV